MVSIRKQPESEASVDRDALEVQLYSLEYQKAAERYENIYKSIWTIFSYLAAIAAGLLTFGSDRIEPHALASIAAIPLLFWFWTTYLPLDRYGNNTVLRRLHELEELLNKRFDVKLSHFSGFAHSLSVIGGIWTALRQLAGATGPKQAHGGRIGEAFRAVWGQMHRARFAIIAFFIALHLLFIYEAKTFWKLHASGQSFFLERSISAPTRGK